MALQVGLTLYKEASSLHYTLITKHQHHFILYTFPIHLKTYKCIFTPSVDNSPGLPGNLRLFGGQLAGLIFPILKGIGVRPQGGVEAPTFVRLPGTIAHLIQAMTFYMEFCEATWNNSTPNTSNDILYGVLPQKLYQYQCMVSPKWPPACGSIKVMEC